MDPTREARVEPVGSDRVPGTGGDDRGRAGQVASTAKDAAGDAAHTAGDQAKRVAGEATSQARSVLEEAKGQVSGLAGQARDELRAQASDRGAQAADSLRNLSHQLRALVDGRPHEAGQLSDYVHEAHSRVSDLATRLDERGIEGALQDLSGFARRRPGLFLAAAAGTGFVVGRLVRSGVSVARSDDDDTQRVGQVYTSPVTGSPTGATMPPPDPTVGLPPTPLTTGTTVP